MIAGEQRLGDMEAGLPGGAEAWEGGWPQTAEAFERLVEAFQDRLVAFAFRRLGNLADAEDVAQEVFVRAYADRQKRREVTRVGAYLYRMTANQCTDHLRRRRRCQVVALEEAGVVEIASDDPGSARLAAAAEEVAKVEGLLGRLPAPQAETVRLCVFGDLAPRQIAEIQGCPEATIKSRLRYGLEKLRQIIKQEWEGLK